MSIPPSRIGIASAPGTDKHRRIPNMPVTVTVGAAGTATFTWPGVPADEIWTGAVSIPLATPASVLPILWSATDGGAPIGQWYNSQSSGPLQVRTQLQVTGSGIAAASLVATLQGIATDVASAPPWWPAPTPAPPPSQPQLIVNSAALPVPSGSSVSISTPFPVPVTVGTSLEVVHASFTNGPGQIRIAWSATLTSTVTQLTTFDLRQSGTGPSSLDGWVIPNLGAYAYITAAATGGGSPLLDCTILTGMPPIARSPIVPSGDLTRYNAAIADGADSGLILLPPYVGDAQIFLTALVAGASPAAGAIFAILRSQDYLGASSELARVGAATQLLAAAGSTTLQPAYIWKMGPRINSIQVYNRIGGGTAVSVDMAISVSGP